MTFTLFIYVFIVHIGLFEVYGFTRSLQMKSNEPVTHAHHQWYVVAENDKIQKNVPAKIILNDVPITLWKNSDNSYAAVHDICPHRGVSLSKGRVDTNTGCIVCPYHTFKYDVFGLGEPQTLGITMMMTTMLIIIKMITMSTRSR